MKSRISSLADSGNRISPRWLIFTLVCLLPLTALSATTSVRPNILLILADDLGFSDIGCYGGEIATPNLDALARNGLRFTQFYNTTRCWPTRASLLTGYYAQAVRRDSVPGVRSGSGGQRQPWAQLIPERLRAQGYRSYHSGKWHIDGKPLENGFDHSYLVGGASESCFFQAAGNTEDAEPVPQTTNYYVTTAIADHAIRCLKEHSLRFPGRPFFHYVAFTAPHFPLQAPDSDIDRYRSTYQNGWEVLRQERWTRLRALGIGGNTLSPPEPDLGPPYSFPEALKKLGPGEVNRPVSWSALTPDQQAFQAAKMAVHAAMVDRMDQEIGRILAQLRAMSAFENTLILFLSDNGASAEIMVRGLGHDPAAPAGSERTFLCLGPGWSTVANTPFRRHKTWVHEGGISTPLIAHWPNQITNRGTLRHATGHVIDVVPTILELAGIRELNRDGPGTSPPSLPGRSLAPLFSKDRSEPGPALWWAHEDNRALRLGDWKIVSAGKTARWELYNLRRDRSETQDLARDYPEKVSELASQWTRQAEDYFALARQDLPPGATNRPARKTK